MKTTTQTRLGLVIVLSVLSLLVLAVGAQGALALDTDSVVPSGMQGDGFATLAGEPTVSTNGFTIHGRLQPTPTLGAGQTPYAYSGTTEAAEWLGMGIALAALAGIIAVWAVLRRRSRPVESFCMQRPEDAWCRVA